MRKVSGILVGLCLIGCGLIYLLCLCGILDRNVSLDGWWTLFIILPCFNGLLTGKDKIGHFIGLTVGILLLLAAQGVFSSHLVWKMVVPIIIVMVGLKILVTSVMKQQNMADGRDEVRAEEHMALFTETTVDYDDADLTAAKIGAVFGGLSDKRALRQKEENPSTLTINGFCVFGGVDIK